MSLAAVFIILAVYNVVVFVIPFDRGGGFWTGYGFSMLAMLLTAGVAFYAFDREGLRSKFYGVPLIFVVSLYFLIQLVLSILQMVLYMVPFQYWIALNTILLGACLVGVITVDASKEEIEKIDEKIKEKVFFIKSLQVDVEGLVNKASDESAKKMLNALSETIRYSDPMSSPQLASIENEIESKAADLTVAVKKSDVESIKVLCEELQQLLAERNRKCKILK
jgi:gas vesicle protein